MSVCVCLLAAILKAAISHSESLTWKQIYG